jgi:hypothetical protein
MALTLEFKWFKRKRFLVVIICLLIVALGFGAWLYFTKACPDKLGNLLGQNGDPVFFDQRRSLQARQDDTGMTRQYGDASLYQSNQANQNQLTPAQMTQLVAQMAAYTQMAQTQAAPASAASTASTALPQNQGAPYPTQTTRPVGALQPLSAPPP